MAQLKHLRAIERGIREYLPLARIEYRPRHGKHYVLVVTSGELRGTFAISLSPTSPDHAVLNTLKEVRRFFQPVQHTEIP